MRHKSFDNFLISIMSAVALFCVYMLYGAKLVSLSSGKEIKIASIVEQLKTVKRKRDFYQGWVDVKPGDGLSQNDEIYTHGQSSAKIRFTNGPEISLFENSLLRIKTAQKGSTFSLDKGNLIAKLNKDSPNLDIELNGKKYSFNSQNANIQIEQGKTENKFLLLDGKARLANQEILPNQVVIQNIKTGDLKIKEIPFILKMPLHNTTIYYLKVTKMKFSWTYTNQSIPVKMTVAKDANFSDVIFEETLENNSHEMNFNHPGTFYWKLSSKDLIDGPIKSFTLIEETSPALNADQTVVYQGPKSTDKVFLNWSKNNGKKFLLKIENSNGKAEEIAVVKNNYEFVPKNIGIYRLSVKVNEDNRPLAVWSEPISITLNEAKSITINSLTPEIIEKVNYNNQASNYLLSWNGPSSGINYKIKITKDKKVLDLETEQTSIPVTLKDAGEYNWEIQGETLSGVTSNKLTGKIIIKAPLHLTQLPSEGAIVELEKPDQLVSFKWDKVDEATLYQFELSDEPTFKKIIVGRDVEVNNISTSLADMGRYYWRVKIKKGSNVEYSNPVSVEIKPSPPLTRPEIAPDIKIKLKYLEEKSSSFNLIDLFISKANAADPVAVAEWDLPANAKAKSYIVEVYKDPGLKELITRMETEVPHVVWKNATVGKFFWRVSYSDFWGRKTEFSKVSVLSTEADPIKPLPVEIELVSPKHHADILKEDSDQSTLSWIPVPVTKNYQILMATDLEFENIISRRMAKDNEIKISCKDFDNRAGDYYWKVISGENASKRRMFTISCTPPPKVEEPKPVVVESKTIEQVPVVEKLNPHFARAGLLPHHISYQNKACQYTAKVDGAAIDSWFVQYQTPLDMKYFQIFTPTLSVSRGKVFKTITFTDMEINLKAKRQQSGFSWGPVAAFMKKTIYVESNLTIVDQSVSSPLLGVFIQKEFDRVTMNAEAKMGTILDLHADFQYRMRNNFSAGLFFDTSSLTKENSKHTFTRYGLNLNYTFDFLDTTK
ncbi:MAG: hypothetical protein H7177_07820 [Rhizobacter sp.]|nr:hypothetical protein [Bacteriovorax sp.]